MQTIKKSLASIFTFSLIFTLSPSIVSAESFSDVPASHPQYAAIESLKNLQVVGGYEDGTFKPDAPVQRVEALKMILLSAGIQAESDGETGFSDVPSDVWFTKYVLRAKQEGIVNGNPDGTFTPAREVNKAEFIKMTLESFNQDISNHEGKTQAIAADVQPSDWFMAYMSFAKTVGIISPDLNDNLNPGKSLTRAECADILYKMLVLDRGGEIQKMLSITESKLVDVLVKIGKNDINGAIASADEAKFYANKALEIDGEKGIVKAATKIAEGFYKLTLAYKAGLEGNNEAVTQLVAEAKDLAGQAYNDDPNTQPLGVKIKEQGDVLLTQIAQ